MQKLIARCGNRCDLCPLYVGNFEMLGPERVNQGLHRFHVEEGEVAPTYARGCAGCLSAGPTARPDCRIRVCVGERGFENCADCGDMFCDLLTADIEVIEGGLSRFAGAITPEEFRWFFKPFLIRQSLTALRSRDRAA